MIAWLKRQARMLAYRLLSGWLGKLNPDAEETQERFFLFNWFHRFRNRVGGNLHLLTIGQSDFGGHANNLPGCKLDAQNMAALYRSYGSSVDERHNLNKASTESAIFDALAKLGEGKTVVIHYSGHGTQITDRDGDEADRKDEAICTALDCGLIADDALLKWCADAVTARGGNLLLMLDTCHSGGFNRSLGADAAATPEHARHIPELFLPQASVDAYHAERKQRGKGITRREVTTFCVMAACGESEYSYDTSKGGAYTLALVRACKSEGNALSTQIHTAIRERVPSDAYPQSPQHYGKAIKVFGGG